MTRISAMALALVLGAAAGQSAQADGEKIAVLTKNQTNPFFQAERVGAAKAAASMHATVLQYVPTQADSIAEQLSEIDDVITKKADAVVIAPVDYKAIVPGIQKINAAKIPVVNVTDRSSGGDFVSFVGADDHTIAKKTAEALLKAIGGKGEVIVLEGVRGTATAQDRLRGFKDALAEFPNVKLVASQPANYQRLQAMQVMENLLQANPNVAGVLAANDTMAIGAMDALSEAGSKALITGINGSKEAVDAIKAGKMLASGDYDGFVQGCIGAMIALRHLRHEETPKQVTQPTVVITKDNLAPYDVPLDQRQCPSWDEVPKS